MQIRQLQQSNYNNSLLLEVECVKNTTLKLKVFSTEGKIAKLFETNVHPGYQNLSFNVGDLSSGNYVLNAFFEEGFIKSIKFIKQ